MSSSVKVVRGSNGFGGPLILTATEIRNKIVMVTGEKTHPVAEKISEITGAVIIDGFATGVPVEEILVAIVDCGGTARCGIYPKKKVKTINLSVACDYGHLSNYIIEHYYASDVTESSISPTTEIEQLYTAEEENSHLDTDSILNENNFIIRKNQQPETKGLKNMFKKIFK